MHGKRVVVTKEEYEKTKGDKEAMKKLALKKLGY